MSNWLEMMAFITAAACLSGCGSEYRNAEPIERTVNRGLDVAEQVALKGIEELSAQTTNSNVAGALIEPGYQIAGKAGLFNGVVYDTTVKAVGTSLTGNLNAQLGPPNKNVDNFGKTKDDEADPTGG